MSPSLGLLKPVLGGSLVFQRTTGSRYLKESGSKNWPFQVFWDHQNQRTAGSGYFKASKESLVLMKELLVLSRFFDFLHFCWFGAGGRYHENFICWVRASGHNLTSSGQLLLQVSLA
jgi:hypothetical protein